jgi:hypothetical protein
MASGHIWRRNSLIERVLKFRSSVVPQFGTDRTAELQNSGTPELRNSRTQELQNSLVSVFVGIPLFRRAAQLVVLALDAPCVGVEPARTCVRFHLAMRAERFAAVFRRLLPAARREAHEPVRLRFAVARRGCSTGVGRGMIGRGTHRVVIGVERQLPSPARAARALLRGRRASARSPWLPPGPCAPRGARTLQAYPELRN